VLKACKPAGLNYGMARMPKGASTSGAHREDKLVAANEIKI